MQATSDLKANRRPFAILVDTKMLQHVQIRKEPDRWQKRVPAGPRIEANAGRSRKTNDGASHGEGSSRREILAMKKERSTIKEKEAGKRKATLVRFLATAPTSGKEQQRESPFDLLIESCFSGKKQEKRANIKATSKKIEATTCQHNQTGVWSMF